MNKKEILIRCETKLKDCINNADTEDAHYRADQALCDLLTALGYGKIVEIWLKVDKWYA